MQRNPLRRVFAVMHPVAILLFVLIFAGSTAYAATTPIYSTATCTTENTVVGNPNIPPANASGIYFGTIGGTHIAQGFSWQSTASFSNVVISAFLQAPWEPGDYQAPATPAPYPLTAKFDAYLTNKEGKLIQHQSSSALLPLYKGGGLLPKAGSYTQVALFTALPPLPADTYYVTLYSSSDLLLWEAQNVATKVATGITVPGGDTNMGAGAGYPYAVAANPGLSVLSPGPGFNTSLCFDVSVISLSFQVAK